MPRHSDHELTKTGASPAGDRGRIRLDRRLRSEEWVQCTLPIEALRAELRGPAGISHALAFTVGVEQESPVRLMVPQRR